MVPLQTVLTCTRGDILCGEWEPHENDMLMSWPNKYPQKNILYTREYWQLLLNHSFVKNKVLTPNSYIWKFKYKKEQVNI